MVYELGELLAETERFPDGPRRTRRRRRPRPDPAGAAAAGHLRRQPARASASTGDDFRRRRVRARRRRPATSGCAARSTASRSCPTTPERLALDCYEAYNIQVSGLEQRLRAIGQPKVVIGVSGGLDSTHALIVAAKAMDRLGPPAQRHPRLHDARLRDRRGDQGQRHPAAPRRSASPSRRSTSARPREQMLADLGHPFADGEPVYDVTFENVQAGLRTDYLFRLANHRGGIVLGTGDLSELALGWCTYGVGDQMSHYNVNAGVPKTLIQHLIRWVIAHRPVRRRPTATRRCSSEILDQEITPELVPAERGREAAERPRTRSGPTRCRTSRSSTCCATASGRARSRSSPCTPGATPTPGSGRRASRRAPAHGLRPADDPALARGVRPALLRVQPVQALRAAQRPEGRRRRLAVAARRLAGAVGRQRPGLAGRARRATCPQD